MKHIALDELRSMVDSEGLVLQGCGGELDEWVSGINEMFTKEGILLDGDTFKDVAAFKNDGMTNLLLNLDNVKLDIGKLAVWRLQTRNTFGGYWLSDYLTNRLGVKADSPQEKQKPNCPLIGQDGNIFNLMGIAARTLKENGMKEEAVEMRERITSSGNYDNALCIIGEYVNITSAEDHEDLDEEFCMKELT